MVLNKYNKLLNLSKNRIYTDTLYNIHFMVTFKKAFFLPINNTIKNRKKYKRKFTIRFESKII